MNSAAGEPGLALLGEGGHAFLGVLAREQPDEAIGLADQVLDVVALERLVYGRLGGGERERTLRGQGAGLSPTRSISSPGS